jgi:hypothetical protein
MFVKESSNGVLKSPPLWGHLVRLVSLKGLLLLEYRGYSLPELHQHSKLGNTFYSQECTCVSEYR